MASEVDETTEKLVVSVAPDPPVQHTLTITAPVPITPFLYLKLVAAFAVFISVALGALLLLGWIAGDCHDFGCLVKSGMMAIVHLLMFLSVGVLGFMVLCAVIACCVWACEVIKEVSEFHVTRSITPLPAEAAPVVSTV